MDLLKPEEPFLFSGTYQKFDMFLKATASSIEPRSEFAKTALLLIVASDDALEVFNNLTLSESEDRENYTTVARKFNEHCQLKQNEVYEKYLFRSRTQAEGEPLEHFRRDLWKQARSCNFAQLNDSMIRDQIVFAVQDGTSGGCDTIQPTRRVPMAFQEPL